MKIQYIFLLALSTLCVGLQAQPYKIRLIDKGNKKLAVEMRITAGIAPTTANSVVDLKFGVRWLASTSTTLGSIIQNTAGTYGAAKSGVEVQKVSNGITYKFQAFGANNCPYPFPTNWTIGTWVEIMSIPVTSTTAVVAFEVCPTGFDGTTERNFNVDLTDYAPDIETNTSVVIPLELLSFEASKTANKTCLLEWLTVNEQKMARYELERSADAKDWSPLSIVAPKNGSQQTYVFEDQKPLGNVNYYRLKMVDEDGSFRYSLTKAVDLGTVQKTRISPNPLTTNGLLHIETATDALFNATLTDVVGRVILQATFSGETWLNTEGVSSGTYFLNLVSKGAIETHKIIKP